MKSKRISTYESTEAATASTTEPRTGNVRWQLVVGLLFVMLLGLVYSIKHMNGVWELEQRNDGYDIGLTVPVEEAEEVEEETSLVNQYRYSCQANTIIAGAYSACKNHRSCQLSDEEMMIMYVAGKTAVIMCKKHEMLELFMGLNEEFKVLEDLKRDELLDEDVEEPDDEEKSAMAL